MNPDYELVTSAIIIAFLGLCMRYSGEGKEDEILDGLLVPNDSLKSSKSLEGIPKTSPGLPRVHKEDLSQRPSRNRHSQSQ